MKKIERVAPSDHMVLFYDDDAELRQSAGVYLRDALSAGNVAVVIASAKHRALFESELHAAGLDLEELTASSSWIVRDAAETLDQLTHEGRLDPVAFESVVGTLVATAAELGRPVCAYGEMVALLWDARQINAAIALEELWNHLGERTPSSLFCSYSSASLSDVSLAHEIEIVGSRSAGIVGAPAERDHGHTIRRSVRTFPPTIEAITEARHFAAGVISDWGHERISQDVQLITSEIASNAVRHAHSAFVLVLSESDSALRIAVFDASHDLAKPQRPDRTSGSGRGLMLIAAIASHWGVEQTDDGKVVWAQVQL